MFSEVKKNGGGETPFEEGGWKSSSSTNVPGERGRERICDAKRIASHPWDICARDAGGLFRVERRFECPFSVLNFYIQFRFW